MKSTDKTKDKYSELDSKGQRRANVIVLDSIFKTYNVGTQDVEVLKNIEFSIKRGEFVIIVGPSGSGKSTILYTLLGLEPPTSGRVVVLEKDLYLDKDEDFRSDFRKKHIGMVYQQSNWIKSLNVIENVAFPMILLGNNQITSQENAMIKLKMVNMEKWSDYFPTELSGGQQQRVAVARALVNNPQIVVADEPTGNLDYVSGEQIMNLLKSLSKNEDKTVIMVTHDLGYLRYADKAIRIFDGEVAGVYRGENYKQLLKDIKSKNQKRASLGKDRDLFKIKVENKSGEKKKSQ